MRFVSINSCLLRQSPRWEQLDAAVLREADPAVGWKLARFDLADRCFDQPAKLPALFFGDRCLQILNLGKLFRTNTTRATSEIPLIQE